MPRLITIVVPVLNEEDSIQLFFESMAGPLTDACARHADIAFEFLFVDDGSTDATVERLLGHPYPPAPVGIVSLSRHFGKEAALTAGLAEARGDAVIVIDVDLQDPPDLIPDMVARWRAGAPVVLAQRADRSADDWRKRLPALWFYTVHNCLSPVKIAKNVGDFRLIDRRVVNELNRLPESRRFMKGLFAWVGFPADVITYTRPARAAGASKFNDRRLWGLAVEGITSFSEAPLVIWSYLGAFIATLAITYATYILLRTLAYGTDVPGYASLLVGSLFLGGVQLIGIGILGEYVGRIYAEVKRRPGGGWRRSRTTAVLRARP